jgi:hypothetical protein
LFEDLLISWVAKSWGFTRIKSTKLSKELEKKETVAQPASDGMNTKPDGETLTGKVQKAVEGVVRQQNKPARNNRGRN